ncbi:dTDP-4-dehydrorhamnose 3,5-epimerase [Parvularcula sp. ZS-1/3]|uniref:dTDP-4-dehydrorhamnose 3,5-epimerase n=1 Tax=Parvularcula mediterranea TaxID=2732508 RepID=A0A7Y3RMD8_9PROT|nr:dTDP-4-dehydrorhamnose 3,5-epimerase [Parvularcula mediterranea]NNU16772.1 dTDP-4-dehydrorhamnose 3,5-epimerase [Parvularcula mediterranea]
MFTRLAIPDVILVEPKRFGDHRGFFSETFHADRYDDAGIKGPFVQDNHSLSRDQGVLRGLHFQIAPSPQGKLVRCTAGKILDVAVDIRKGSPTFGQHVSAELTADNGHQLWVPVGFAHGFVTLTPDTEVQYKVTGYYDPNADRGLAWDDPALGIDWGLGGSQPVLSDKDTKHPTLAELPEHFTYEG